MPGYPDFQRITQWIGAELDEGSATAIPTGAGVTRGPFPVASWQGVIVFIKPTGGSVTATLKNTHRGIPASLEVDQQVIALAGHVTAQSFELFGDTVSLTMVGGSAGVTADWAIVPSNTTLQIASAAGVTGVSIGGIVSSAGAALAGSGYAVVRTGVGVYVVTFSAPFAATPVISLAVQSNGRVADYAAPAASGFTCQIWNTAAGAPDDQPWNFLATAL